MSVLDGECTFNFSTPVDRKGPRMALRLLVAQEVRTAAVASKERFLQSALAHELVADINAEKHAVRTLGLKPHHLLLESLPPCDPLSCALLLTPDCLWVAGGASGAPEQRPRAASRLVAAQQPRPVPRALGLDDGGVHARAPGLQVSDHALV